jgi:hypothetical protein
MLNVMGVL